MAIADYLNDYLGVPQDDAPQGQSSSYYQNPDDPAGVIRSGGNPAELAEAARRSSQGYNQSQPQAWSGQYAIPWDSAKQPGSSPKYAFRDIAYRNPWGRDQLPNILSSLQQTYPQYFKGWKQVGDDKIEYDPNSGVPLHSEFGGWTGFDVIAGGDPRYMWLGYQKNGQNISGQTTAPKTTSTSKTAAPAAAAAPRQLVPGPQGTNLYDDPSTKQLVDTINARIASLGKEVDTSAFENYIQALSKPSTSSQGFLGQLDTRIGELGQDPWTASEKDIKQTQLIDPLMRSREQLKKRYADQLMAQGHAPTSGMFTQTQQDIDRAFLEQEAPIYAQLALEERDERNRRKDQAVGYGGVRAQTLEGDRTSRLADLASIIEAAESRRGIQEGREREKLSTTALLPELDERRMMLALQAFGATPSGNASAGVNDTLTSLMSLQNSQAQQAYNNQLAALQLRQQGQQGWLGGLGQLAALLFGE